MFGTKRFQEAGRKMSADNEQRVRDAFKHLSELLAAIEPSIDPGTAFGSQVEAGREAMWARAVESLSPSQNAKVCTLAELRESIQVITETPEPEAVASLSETDVNDDVEPNLLEAGTVGVCDSPLELKERAIAKDGITEIKIISPGWGTTGYYGMDVLQRDGPKAFKEGTKMFWDHPTKREEMERPERSIRDLAAELTENARWETNHKRGPGLYANAKVFSNYREAVEEYAPSIGVSIRAWGKGKQGEAEGRKGSVVTAIERASSIDFVTIAGAGGEINTRFVEAGRLASQKTQSQEKPTMDTESETKLREADAKVTAAQTELREATERAERAETALVIREAGDIVATELAKISNIPDVTKARLTARLGVNPPMKEGKLDREALATTVIEAAREESDYLAKVTGRSVAPRASISGREATQTDGNELVEAFRTLGMSEDGAKLAANGR